jgi:AcrR family transcriptional regulator
MRAAARMTAERTYLSLSVPLISADAGTSNQTFYEHFRNKEAATLAAFDALTAAAVDRSSWRLQTHDSWESAAAGSILALLEALATDPLLAELLFFELPSIGPHAIDHAARALHPFNAFLQPAALPPEATHLPPPVVVTALTYGLWAIVEQEVVEGRAAELPDLAPELLEIALTPFGLKSSW